MVGFSHIKGQATIFKVIKASVCTSLLSRRSCLYHQAYSRLPSIFEQRTIIVIASLSPVYIVLLGFIHVIRLALGGQAKSEHGYRIELITYHSY